MVISYYIYMVIWLGCYKKTHNIMQYKDIGDFVLALFGNCVG
jgi:hypothetical protein